MITYHCQESNFIRTTPQKSSHSTKFLPVRSIDALLVYFFYEAGNVIIVKIFDLFVAERIKEPIILFELRVLKPFVKRPVHILRNNS